MAEYTINDFNTLPEQVQINKEDIKKLSDSSTTQTEQLQALNTKVSTNTANIATNTSNIDNLSKNVYDNGTLSFQIDKDNSKNCFTFKDNTFNTWLKIISKSNNYDWSIRTNSNKIYLDSALDCSTLMIQGSGKINYIYDYDFNSHSGLLTAAAIHDTYLKKTDASDTYLTKTDASNTYLSKIAASNTYVTKQDYDERYDTGDIQFTTQGWTKFEAITDTEGQTITLSVPGDLLEHVQVTGTNDLKLQLVYNGHAIFENIYLHPNNSINNLDYIAGAKSTYFTGQAVLTLSTQSKALFYIVYQETTEITLHLITTF